MSSTTSDVAAAEQVALIGRIRLILQKIRGTSESDLEKCITLEEARQLIVDVKRLVEVTFRHAGIDDRAIRQITTKLRDSGRRSPPWQPGSDRGPHRRPQDGADGNRQTRWLFPPDHKFWATELMATMVEVKYYLQVLSMEDAPSLPDDSLSEPARNVLGHDLKPGAFRDPLTYLPVSLKAFVTDRRSVESGHVIPLGREVGGVHGRHNLDNSTLMLRDSNRIQADKTIPELLDMFEETLKRHGYDVDRPSR